MPHSSRLRGSHFEQLAERMLRQAGLRTIERNFSCRLGEIDLVMDDGSDVIFVEVRYRERTDYGSPLETITPAKQLRVVRAAHYYLQRHPEFAQRTCRFDAVGVSGTADEPQMRWIKNAFSA